MGFGTLNVWIHDPFSPCKISNDFWFVNVNYCSGQALEYCNKTFHGLDANCGHAEFDLPPGCYVVQAFQIHFIPGNPVPRLVTTYSNSAIVMVECDEKACVHIYSPSLWWWIFHVRDVGWLLAAEEGVPREKAKQLADAANSLLEDLPKSGHDEAHERAVQEAASKAKDKKK